MKKTSMNRYEKNLQQTTKEINQSHDITEKDKEILLNYKREMALNGLATSSIANSLAHAKRIASALETPLREAQEPNLKNVIEQISRKVSPRTTLNYKKEADRLWKKQLKNPAPVEWMDLSPVNVTNTLPKDLLTPTDIDTLIQHATNPRDKALIATLWETGARIGELIDLTVGDIEDREHGRKIVISGKTGARRIPLRESVPYLNRWISDHPEPQRSNDLWAKLRGSQDRIQYDTIRAILSRIAGRADLDKPVNPHHFRHSRASFLANRFTEAQLCEWFGWVQGSDVPAKYVHLSGRDIDNAYNKLHGIEDEEQEETKPRTQTCPRCKEIERPDASFCNNCGQAFNLEAAETLENAEQAAEKEALSGLTDIQELKAQIGELQDEIDEMKKT